MAIDYAPVNSFRKRRGRLIRKMISDMSRALGRDISILDIGGREDYWENVGLSNIREVRIINYVPAELQHQYAAGDAGIFVKSVGDARDLSDYADQSVDFVHSNSVIEHVGGWRDMRAMAQEATRVGRAGWIQTPAWSFPIEPHFRTPFMHWFGRPAQVRMLSLSPNRAIRAMPLDQRRRRVENINLLSKRELAELFPGRTIHTERVLFAKSYAVAWSPA